MTLAELGEREFIATLRNVLPGMDMVGDDGAVLPSLACPVVTTDSFFEETHFHRWWAPPEVLGRRLLEATISDLAAMGAVPMWIFSAVSVVPEMEVEWLLDFYRGLSALEEVKMAGGETIRGGGFGMTLTAVGEGGDSGELFKRSALKPGDALWVGGPVGRALDAPAMLERCGGLTGEGLEPVRDMLSPVELEQVRAFIAPRAQTDLALHLKKSGVRCAIDVSDGLLSEAAHIAGESGVDVVLKLETSIFFPSVGDRPLEAAAAGEDFVLLFAADPEKDFTAEGCRRVGNARKGEGGLRVFVGDVEVETDRIGYDHMKPE